MPLLAPNSPEAPRLRAYETDCSSCTVRTSEKGGVQKQRANVLWAPSAKTWPHVRRSCDSDYCAERQDRSVFHLQGWACSPPCRRVWGATAMLWSAGRSTVTREALPAHFPTAHSPATNRWRGQCSAFSGIGIDKCSARDPSSD